MKIFRIIIFVFPVGWLAGYYANMSPAEVNEFIVQPYQIMKEKVKSFDR